MPTFDQIFTNFELELPVATQLVVSASRGFWPIIVPCFLGMIVFLCLLRVLVGPANWSRLISAMPGFGSLIRWSAYVELLQLLRLQVAQQVTIPESLRSASVAVRDANVQVVAKTLAVQVENGWSLADAMAAHGEVPGGITPIIHWDEQHDELPHAIDSITELLTGRIRYRATLVTKFLPGIMLITIGAATAYLVIALMLPMVSLIQNISS